MQSRYEVPDSCLKGCTELSPRFHLGQSSEGVWKWRWPSWAPVPNKPYGLCGRKATLNCSISELRSCVKVEVAVLGSRVPNSPYGLCGRKATLEEEVGVGRGGGGGGAWWRSATSPFPKAVEHWPTLHLRKPCGAGKSASWRVCRKISPRT